jgi:hypothetical protein
LQENDVVAGGGHHWDVGASSPKGVDGGWSAAVDVLFPILCWVLEEFPHIKLQVKKLLD